jgi:hypothetical protein
MGSVAFPRVTRMSLHSLLDARDVPEVVAELGPKIEKMGSRSRELGLVPLGLAACICLLLP